MTYRTQAARIADRAERSLADLWAAYTAGRISRDEFRRLAVATTAAHNRQAARVADVALAVDLTRAGRRATPTGAVPEDTERLDQAFDTVLGKIAAGRLAATTIRMLGRWEALAAAQDAYADGMRRQGVEMWTRQASPTACKICRDLTGEVLPVSVTMYHHPGCGCTQQPVVA